MSSLYPRGSEWRKWDLHVHTPSSLHNGYGGNWDEFLSAIEALPPEFAVLGINDYLFLDGYKRLLQAKSREGRLRNIAMLFPVVEFRIRMFAGVEFRNTKRINLHVIFDPSLDPTVIESQFLNTIHSAYALDPGRRGATWSGAVTPESLAALGAEIKRNVPPDRLKDFGSDLIEGFNSLNVDERDVLDRLQTNTFLRGRYLTAVGKTEWDELQWTEGSIAEKKDILNKVDLVFTAAEFVDHFHRAHQRLTAQQVNNVLLDCSDAHHFPSNPAKDRIGNCFTWIKADPTFAGLKQVTFEPGERIRVQSQNPAFGFTKRYFSSIDVGGAIFSDTPVRFGDTTIELNRNLVTLIGGRGSGKSLLLDCLRCTFAEKFKGQFLFRSGIRKQFNIGLKFTPTLTRDDSEPPARGYTIHRTGENAFDYLHVSQSEIKVVSESPKALSEAIGQLLGLRLDASSIDRSQEVRAVNLEIWKLEQELYSTSEGGQPIDLKAAEQKQIARSKELIATISTEQTKAEIATFTQNTKRIEQAKTLEKEIAIIQRDIIAFLTAIGTRVEKANRDAGVLLGAAAAAVPTPTMETPLDQLATLSSGLETLVHTLQAENARLAERLGTKGIKEDIQTILEKVGLYQQQIELSAERIKLIEKNEARLTELRQARTASVAGVEARVREDIEQVQAAFVTLRAGKPDWTTEQKALVAELLKDIEITAETVFDDVAFYAGLAQAFLNLRKFKPRGTGSQVDRLRETMNVSDFASFMELLKNVPMVTLDHDSEQKLTVNEFAALPDYFAGENERNTFFDYLYCPAEQHGYLKVLSRLKYRGKEPDKLSVGQKGTFYVCMKLATDPFTTPFVFDQPEDDLDNDFIMNDLVPIFKLIKRYRQVIIATHNANLVVNTDADQVIIASNVDEQLSYHCGALEDDAIRRRLVTILEGGEAAFRKREQKYRLPVA